MPYLILGLILLVMLTVVLANVPEKLTKNLVKVTLSLMALLWGASALLFAKAISTNSWFDSPGVNFWFGIGVLVLMIPILTVFAYGWEKFKNGWMQKTLDYVMLFTILEFTNLSSAFFARAAVLGLLTLGTLFLVSLFLVLVIFIAANLLGFTVAYITLVWQDKEAY